MLSCKLCDSRACGKVLLLSLALYGFTACREVPDSETAHTDQKPNLEDAYQVLAENLLACAESDPWFNDPTQFPAIIEYLAQQAEERNIAQRESVAAAIQAARSLILAHEYLCTEAQAHTTTPTDDDCLQYYTDNPAEFTSPLLLRVRQIVAAVPQQAPAETWQKAQYRVDHLYQRLLDGEDFALLARNFSDGPEAIANGDLGFISKGLLAASFEQVVFNLADYEVSKPFRTELGFHIVQVVDRQPAQLIPYEQVKTRIRSALYAERQRSYRRELIKDAWGRGLP